MSRLKGLSRFAGLIPGPLGTIASYAGDPDDDDEDDDSYGYSRGYGYLAGDPGKGKRAKSSKGASAGRARAGQKKSKKHKGRSSAKPHGPGLDFGKLGQAALGAIPVVGGVAQELAGQLMQKPGEELATVPGGALIPTGDGGVALVPHGRGGRAARQPHMAHRKVDAWMVKGSRTMNPTNVHALRRSMRRVEGFEHLVKRVEKMFPRLKRAHTTHAVSSHKAGCRCKTCR
jgi:hypothetical protein